MLVRTSKDEAITSLKSGSSDALVSIVPSAWGGGRWRVARPERSPMASSSTVTRLLARLRRRLARSISTMAGTGSYAMALVSGPLATAMRL